MFQLFIKDDYFILKLFEKKAFSQGIVAVGSVFSSLENGHTKNGVETAGIFKLV